MSWDDEDQSDEWLGELYSEWAHAVLAGRDDLYGEVISHFAADRLRSYYIDNPRVADAPAWALMEARTLLTTHASAALVHAAAAAEVCLKAALLRPIIHGLVHDESAAAMVASLIPEQRNDKFRDALLAILRQCGSVDLRTAHRGGARKSLWQELEDVQKTRNDVVHRAEQAPPEDAILAVEVAAYIVEHVFPVVVQNLGLHFHGNLEVCGRRH
jgi:hypothetical protein